LLSDSHLIGRYKAAVFRTLGYESSAWQTMQRDIEQFLNRDAEEIEITEYGKKYTISGSIYGPNGRKADIVTAWMVRAGEDFPRFVTAYPED